MKQSDKPMEGREKKKVIPMYQCRSIYNGETKQVENCTCGKCADAIKKYQ